MSYDEFINNILNNRGRFACGEEYHEQHHIKPKCLGGTNDKDNLIDLFAKEHFIAHKLLAKENPDNSSLVYAWSCMAFPKNSTQERYELTPEEYEEARIALAETQSKIMKERFLNPENHPNYGKHHSEETKRKISEKAKERYKDVGNHPMFGKTLSLETRQKISKAHIGKTLSDEHRRKLREIWTDEKRELASQRFSGENGVWFGKHFSEEHRAKISAALSGENNPMYGRCGELNPMFGIHRYGEDNPFYGKHHTDETKTKISEAKRGKPQSAESNKKRSESERGHKNPRARKVIRLIDLKVYDCLDYAATDNSMHRDTIWKRCKKHNGFMYYDEYLTIQNDLENNIC